MSNQVQIPYIQTKDDALNQVQQNVNKVLRNFGTQIIALADFALQEAVIGEIKLAALTLAQFQTISGTDWIVADGQSAIGTKYNLLTGNTTVPTVTVTGATAFIRVN